MNAPGRLLLAATPIGNPADASERLRAALREAGVVAVEDTRRLRYLTRALAVSPRGRVLSLYDTNEAARVPELLAALRQGQTVLVLTDAGTPGVSDPGYRVVRAAIDAGIAVQVLPGPSAVIAALVVSGLPVHRFCFEGFLARRAAERRRRIAELATDPRTLVLFEATHRLAATLRDLAASFGIDRPAAVCRELTKEHEEIRRGSLGDLAEWAGADRPRGEMTLVVAGAPPPPPPTHQALVDAVRALEESGLDRRAAIGQVATALGVSRRVVYQAMVAAGRT